jgi:beta-glucanase (GH16 family)
MPHIANGLWPAFWMLGSDIATNPWPACGEIDIVEMGNATGIANGTQNATHTASLQDDFHLFTLIWDERSIKLYLDLDLDLRPTAAPYFTMDITDKSAGAAGYYFHKPFYFLFNLAVGGYSPSTALRTISPT